MKKTAIGILSLIFLLAACGPAPAGRSTASRKPEITAVVRWNEAMLAAIRSGTPRPTVVTRQMFLVHTAMYDAWTAYDASATPHYMAPVRRPAGEWDDAHKTEAISYAAYEILVFLFPNYEVGTRTFTRLMTEQGFDPRADAPPGSPAAIGRQAAAAVLEAREDDGSNWQDDFADTTSAYYPILYSPINSANPAAPTHLGGPEFNPNYWEPLRVPTGIEKNQQGLPVANPDNATSFRDQRFLTPHWGAVTPFALTRGDQFRPAPPPRYGDPMPYTDARGRTMSGDEAYRRQFTEVLLYSAGLTDEQKVIAEYWADGPRSETPPGHWNALAHGISWRDRHTLDDDVCLFFALNGALLDAGIATWEAKRHYDFIRPVSAIRFLTMGQLIRGWGGPNQGTRWILGETWRPYQALTFVTPGFPEYTSGHSAFSAAAAAVLRAYTGSDRFYDGVTELPEDFNGDGRPDLLGQHIVYAGGNHFESGPAETIILHWPTLQAAADEAGISRLYGGIHIQDGDIRGRELGRSAGEQAYAKARHLWSGSP